MEKLKQQLRKKERNKMSKTINFEPPSTPELVQPVWQKLRRFWRPRQGEQCRQPNQNEPRHSQKTCGDVCLDLKPINLYHPKISVMPKLHYWPKDHLSAQSQKTSAGWEFIKIFTSLKGGSAWPHIFTRRRSNLGKINEGQICHPFPPKVSGFLQNRLTLKSNSFFLKLLERTFWTLRTAENLGII